MKKLIKSLLSIGIKEHTSTLKRLGKVFFNFDCLIALISSIISCCIYWALQLSIFYILLSLILLIPYSVSLWLHKKDQYKKATHVSLFSTYIGILVITILSQSLFLPLLLIPFGISFFIYLTHGEKETSIYFSLFMVSGIVLFLVLYYMIPHNESKDMSIVNFITISSFSSLFLYKTLALIYIYKNTIKINKEKEEALKLNEHQYRTQFEKTQLGIVVFDNKMSLNDVNPSFCNMIGYTKEELLNGKILESCLAKTPKIIEKMHLMMTGDLTQFKTEKVFTKKGGSPLITSAFITGIYDQHGNFVNTNCSFLDDTEKVLTEKALQKNETVYRDIFENMHDALIILDANANILEFNPAANRLFECDNLKVLKVSDLIHPDDREKSNIYFYKLKEYGFYTGYEGRVIIPNGKVKYIEVDSIAIKDESGNLIGSRDIVKDITDRKIANDALKDSETRYRTLFENAFDGLIIYDLDTRKNISCNSKLPELFKLSKEEIIEDNMLQYLPKNQEILTKDKVQYQCVNYDSEGNPFNTEITSIRLPAPNRNLVVSIFKDITEKKKQDKIIQHSVEELNKKNKALQKYIESNMQLKNFAYIASHDLKAPLRTIISYAQLISRRSSHKLDNTELEFLSFIIEATKNMSNLIEALLTYSKVDTQAKSLVEFNVETLLYSIVQELKTDLEENNVQIYIGSMPSLIIADTTRLRQLFQNLIANSIKFKSKIKNPVININCLELDTHFQFSVQDNGIGIKPKFHEKVFSLFTKLHTSQEYDGTGIGLALCQKIVDQHEGKIWIESRYGEGTTFYFTISKPSNLKDKSRTLQQASLNKVM